jgi:hypothetical protein
MIITSRYITNQHGKLGARINLGYPTLELAQACEQFLGATLWVTGLTIKVRKFPSFLVQPPKKRGYLRSLKFTISTSKIHNKILKIPKLRCFTMFHSHFAGPFDSTHTPAPEEDVWHPEGSGPGHHGAEGRRSYRHPKACWLCQQ